MKTTLTRIIFTLSVLLNTQLFSQDIKGGDIRFTQLGGNQYQVAISLYQKTSAMISRPYLNINWGDNTYDSAQLNSTTAIAADWAAASYTAMHTYPGAGNYTLTVADSFWVNYLLNVPNSANEGIYLHANVVVNPLAGTENSSAFVNTPVPVSNSNGVLSYNAAATDPDGDSLVYQLISPTMSYALPANASIDPVSGNFTMTPMSIGSYVIGIQVTEWRHISTSTMQVGDMMRCMVIDVDSLTSAYEIYNGGVNVTVFPNPATDELIFDFGKEIANGELVITDESGREVKSLVIKNQDRMEVYVADLDKGIYFCRLIENGERKVVKKVTIK